jgi:hypothetical protein
LILIEQQGQNYGNGEAGSKLKESQTQSIPEESPELEGGEKVSEMFETHPGTAADTLHEEKILEGNLNPVHWDIVKNEKKEKTRQNQQIELPLLFNDFG